MENSMRLDRLATWNEVCCAISFSLDGAFDLGCTCDADCEREPDFSDPVGILAEDLTRLVLASEFLDPKWN